jgi:uncharacterized membrane protein
MSVLTIEIFDDIALAVSIAGSVIIIWSVLITIVRFSWAEFSKFREKNTTHHDMENIRISFGGYLLLGLDFMLAADIIHTIHNPELKELYVLALIVAIRSVISFFLTKEIQESKAVGKGKV